MIGWFFPCSIGKKPFLVFQRVSVKEVEHLIDVSSLTSCDLVDPVPARILKGCKSTLLPTLTSIVISVTPVCVYAILRAKATFSQYEMACER